MEPFLVSTYKERTIIYEALSIKPLCFAELQLIPGNLYTTLETPCFLQCETQSLIFVCSPFVYLGTSFLVQKNFREKHLVFYASKERQMYLGSTHVTNWEMFTEATL